MKMNFSNKQLLDSLSKSYDIQKGDNKKIIIFSIIGAAAGAIVTAYFLTSHQRRRMKEMASNLQKQVKINNQLQFDQLSISQQLNEELLNKPNKNDTSSNSNNEDVTT